MKSLIPTLLFILLVSGCATVANGPTFSESKAQAPIDGKALVYVFRDTAQPTALGCSIFIDGTEVTTLNEKGFTWFTIDPGDHALIGKWSKMSSQKNSSIALSLEENQTYYIELTGNSGVSAILGPVIVFKVSSGLNLVEPENAISRISEYCKYQLPLSNNY